MFSFWKGGYRGWTTRKRIWPKKEEFLREREEALQKREEQLKEKENQMQSSNAKERFYDNFRNVPVKYIDYLIAACGVAIVVCVNFGHDERQRNLLICERSEGCAFSFGKILFWEENLLFSTNVWKIKKEYAIINLSFF